MGGELWMEIRDRKKLAQILVIQGVSSRQLARAAGWKSHSYAGALLRGEKKTVTTDSAHRIARFLGHTVDDLFVERVSTNPVRPVQSRRKVA
jgi:transcriptional regulator with XRE-family HTH domain